MLSVNRTKSCKLLSLVRMCVQIRFIALPYCIPSRTICCCTAGGGRRDRCSWDPGVTAGGDNACHAEEDEDKVELKYVDVLIIIFMHPVLKMW